MSTNLEIVPAVWTAADEAFFRLTATVLPPAFVAGASVLLASYDTDAAAPTTEPTPATQAPVPAQSTDLVPVVVRRPTR